MTKEEGLEVIKKSMECHDREVCDLAENCEGCSLYVDKNTEYEAHKVLLPLLSSIRAKEYGIEQEDKNG